MPRHARLSALLVAVLVAPTSPLSPAADCVLSTLAGGGGGDGVGTNAGFASVNDVIPDALPGGMLVLADRVSNRVRRIAPDGSVTTWAAGDLSTPVGLAQMPDGTLFVVESSAPCRVRVVSPGGALGTLAGSGACATLDGVGTAAAFRNPRAAHWWAAGAAVVIAEASCVRLIAFPGGAVTTVAGGLTVGFYDGRGTAARINCNPGCGLAVAPFSPDGSVLIIADAGNARLRTLNLATWDVGTWAGGGAAGAADGRGTAAGFSVPINVKPDGTGVGLLVSDYGVGGRAVRRVDAAGAVTTLLGTGPSLVPGAADGAGAAAAFSLSSGQNVRSAVGLGGGRVAVADGNLVRLAVCGASLAAPSAAPAAASASPSRTPSGTPSAAPAGGCFVTTIAGGNATASTTASGVGTNVRFGLMRAGGIAVAPGDTVYIAHDVGIVRSVAIAGGVGSAAVFAGTGANAYADGTGTNAAFSLPSGVAYDATTGTLIIADTGNGLLRRATLGGVVTIAAGVAGSAGFADGVGAVARLTAPACVAVDAAGAVFFTDLHNSLRVLAGGAVRTLVGSPRSPAGGWADGASAPPFSAPAAPAARCLTPRALLSV